MDELQLLTFEPWADPAVDAFDTHPEGTYSRLAWLPIIGPSSWLMWGTLASQLRREPQVTWELTALAEAHGLQRGAGQHGMVRRTVTRLTQFRLLAAIDDTHHLVRLTAPPVTSRQLERLPAFVAELHQQTFAQDPHREVG
jgi:hypothetical protein